MSHTRLAWFLAFPDTELLDVCGPWEVFAHANDVIGHAAYRLELRSAVAGTLTTRHGLDIGTAKLLPRRTTRLPEIAIVAGGSPISPLPDSEAHAADWLRRYGREVPTVASICTGAFVLGEAGLLDGRPATTHWMHLERLRERFPGCCVSDDGIFTREANVWTSAGMTAGMDLALSLLEEQQGHAVAIEVAKRLVLYLRRPGTQAQFSSALRRQQQETTPLSQLSSFIVEHIHEPLSVERLAAELGMSTRSLTRWCQRTLGQSPALIVREYRLEEARRLLECSELSIKQIATRTGMGEPSTMWRVCAQSWGISPAEYRQRFAAAAR